MVHHPPLVVWFPTNRDDRRLPFVRERDGAAGGGGVAVDRLRLTLPPDRVILVVSSRSPPQAASIGRTLRLMKRTHLLGLLTVLLVNLAGCGGTTDPSVATTVTLSPTTLSFSSLGDTEQLTATVRDQDGATISGASIT